MLAIPFGHFYVFIHPFTYILLIFGQVDDAVTRFS